MTFCFFILLIVGFFSLPFQTDISFPIRISFGFYINSNANSFYSVSCLASSLQYEKDNQQTIVITSPSNYCRVVYGTVLIVSHWWSDTVVSTECLTVPYDPVCYIDMIYSLLIFREKSHKIFANHFFSVFIFFLNFLKVKHIYVNLMYQTIFC